MYTFLCKEKKSQIYIFFCICDIIEFTYEKRGNQESSITIVVQHFWWDAWGSKIRIYNFFNYCIYFFCLQLKRYVYKRLTQLSCHTAIQIQHKFSSTVSVMIFQFIKIILLAVCKSTSQNTVNNYLSHMMYVHFQIFAVFTLFFFWKKKEDMGRGKQRELQ